MSQDVNKGATGGHMWLHEQICGYMSQVVAAGAMLWLQEPRFKIIKSLFSSFVHILVFFTFTVFRRHFT